MGYDAPDLYNQPELFDLKPVGEVEWTEPSYSFDTTIVWHHKDGSFYLASDSGCSCPAPFEGFTSLADAEHLPDVNAVLHRLKELLDERAENKSWVERNSDGACADVLDLTSKLVRMRATPTQVNAAIASIQEALQ